MDMIEEGMGVICSVIPDVGFSRRRKRHINTYHIMNTVPRHKKTI